MPIPLRTDTEPNGHGHDDGASHLVPGAHGGEHEHHQRDGVVKRIKRAEGHLGAVRRMVEEGRDCPDILIQLAAVRAALDAAAKVVLADHVESCLHDAQQNGDTEAAWHDLKRALESFIR
ncbi:MAG: metal-sensing transcriptional repressor [Chloroflexota bacterium]